MIRLAILALALVVATVAQAEEPILPALYDVSGVAADDTLNVRAGPSIQSQIIGELAPRAAGIEVLQRTADGKWAKIGWEEANGWVSLRFMTARPVLSDGMPRPMRCHGTEPFWYIDLMEGGVTGWTALDEEIAYTVETEYDGFGGAVFAFGLRSGQSSQTTLIIEQGICGNGMTDRDYGFLARVFEYGQGNTNFRRGCCTLDLRQ